MIEQLLSKALSLDKLSIAKLITHFEDSRPEAAKVRQEILELLRAHDNSHKAGFVGFTGTPGVGKSSLIGEISNDIISRDSAISVAVIAVDPSSQVSGGSFLGDRTRVRFPLDEPRLFFRSQASDTELGGVSRHTFQVCRLLGYLFDYVFVETVGIGQSEIEIQYVSDRIYLVLQPLSGDQIQFMKAGIMEIPDVFILNKSDQIAESEKSYHSLRASLSFVRPGDEDSLRIIRTSTVSGQGIDELVEEIVSFSGYNDPERERFKEEYFFTKWVRDEYGRLGVQVLRETLGGASAYIEKSGAFDLAQFDFSRQFSSSIARA